jgi:TPR repeat protein
MALKFHNVDFETAFYWYLEAAKLGHAMAQFYVGQYIDDGYVKNKGGFKEAKKWFNLSAEQGYLPAKRKLNLLCRIVGWW